MNLSAEFDYAPWNQSGFGPSALLKYFKYKYLGLNLKMKKNGSIISVVGKTTVEIIELFECRQKN